MATATKQSRANRRVVRRAAAVSKSAAITRVEPGAASDPPVDLVARRSAAAVRDDSDERWQDEGGSFIREAVTKWPAQH